MGRLAAAFAASFTLFATTAVGHVAVPASADPSVQPAGSMPIPDGPAPSWIVADLDTGQVLAGRDMYAPHPPASTIKTLLALTALDEVNLDATMVASTTDTYVECNCAGIKPGRTYSARQLLDAALLVSGNDAANALAAMLGGHDVAVDKMNAKAAAIGATDTHATSPSGLDGPGWESVTTPYDLAMIYRAALSYPLFAQILHQPTAAFPDGAGGFKRIASHDPNLPDYPGFIGGKTGYTNLAQETYVAMAQRDGRQLIAVMMYGKDDLWDQGRALLDWGFAQS